MKKIFIACSKHFYGELKVIKKKLEIIGYDVILPNFYDTPMIEEDIKKLQTKQDHIDFFKKSFLMSEQKAKECDAILVLNFDRIKQIRLYKNGDLTVPKAFHNYVGGATFLEIYEAYKNNKELFIYNEIPGEETYTGMVHDELVGMGCKSLNGDIFNIQDNYIKFEKNNLLNYFTIEQLKTISEIRDLYARAFVITSEVFKDKKDKAGKPYFNHLFRVSMKLDEQVEQVSALLHDIVEDTDITFKDLLEIGFPVEVIEIVELVTKSKIDTTKLSKEQKLKLYSDKIDSIINSNNIHAIRLKQADMSDNYNKERLKDLPEEKQEWFEEKYNKQLVKLMEVTERNKIL